MQTVRFTVGLQLVYHGRQPLCPAGGVEIPRVENEVLAG